MKDHQAQFTQQKLERRLGLLLQHRFVQRIEIPSFQCWYLPTPDVRVPDSDDLAVCPHVEVHAGDYWIGQQQEFWLETQIDLNAVGSADSIALYLPLGYMGDVFNHPEALVRLDDQLLGSADRHHHVIRIPEASDRNSNVTLSLQGWSGLAGWPIDTANKSRLQMGECALVELCPELEELHTVSQVVLQSCRALGAEHALHGPLLQLLDDTFLCLTTDQVGEEDWFDSCKQALQCLTEGLAQLGAPEQVRLQAIGHAHLDIAYLWPVAQSRLKNARTTSNQLSLMRRHPAFRYSQSQPALYDMLSSDYPELYQEVLTRVQSGQWEVLGGMWVEPDVNLPGPESLVRQLLLARQYCDTRFHGEDTRVLWLPDSFGFPWCLPQLMLQAGIDVFITSKLHWNQTNKPPSSTHRWRGMDGSEVLAHVLTTPRPVAHLPFPSNYKSDLSADEVLGTWQHVEGRGALNEWPICYGFGDGGGGPNEQLVQAVKAYERMPGMPSLSFSRVDDYVGLLRQHRNSLPVWDDEHYFEGHRGTYTSQAWLKRANRQLEHRLHTLEALAVMVNRPINLSDVWATLCLTQFHDTLAGTAVPEALDEARADVQVMMESLDAVEVDLLNSQQHTDQQHTDRQHANDHHVLVSVLPYGCVRRVEHPQKTGSRSTDQADARQTRLVHCPPYSVQRMDDLELVDVAHYQPITIKEMDQSWRIENQWLSLEINSAGQLSQLVERQTGRAVIEPPYEVQNRESRGNRFQIFEDRPLVWDAWDIEPYFEDRCAALDASASVTLAAHTDLSVDLSLVHRYRSSQIQQTIRIHRHSRRIDFITKLDWHEPNALLKVGFPTTLRCRQACYDIQWGVIERPTHRNTSWDKARFEVPAHKWACLREPGYSVALLNDCKYGYDALDGRLRLTLLKTSGFPDPQADLGEHRFTYSLLALPEDGLSTIQKEAWELNVPLCYGTLDAKLSYSAGTSWVSCDQPSVVIQTIKHSEDGECVVLRLYESEGGHINTRITFAQPVIRVEYSDILESKGTELELIDTSVALTLSPFEILTLRVSVDGATAV